MSKKRRKSRRRARSGQQGTTVPAPAPAKRRLPRPTRPTAVSLTLPAGRNEDNPFVANLVAQVQRACAASNLAPFTVILDWAAMFESVLERWAENGSAILLTGHPAEDPPEIAAIFSRVRERYNHISRARPAAYRTMQETYMAAFLLLMEAAQPGLEAYSRRSRWTPDVIGQAFIATLDYDANWAPWFPDWAAALEWAAELFPDGHDLAYQRPAEAAALARMDGKEVSLEPARNFEVWYAAIEPYLEPLVIGPPPVTTGVSMLALATRFPDWLAKQGEIRFTWPVDLHPLLQGMNRLNSYLYGLNGTLVQQIDTWNEAVAQLDANETTAQPPPLTAHPQTLYQTEPTARHEPPPSPDDDAPAGPSFADLFKNRR